MQIDSLLLICINTLRMYIFKRKIEDKILKSLKKQGLVILLGPRQSGKTTLVKKIVKDLNGEYFLCERADVRKYFVEGEPEKLKELVGDNKLVIFDEAQTIVNIGKILKLFYDTYPKIKVIATGSSSFELSNKIKEPMTGRATEFTLLPLSLSEIRLKQKVTKTTLSNLLLFGCYPAVVNAKTREDKMQELYKIATNYLYKDVFSFEEVRNPKVFEDLLIHLAWSVGSTISTNKLANELGIAKDTVERYIRLLEQAFVIKRVYSFSRNYANELKKSYKIYFYDMGIRNTLVDLGDKIEDREDKGALLEGMFFAELLKKNSLQTVPAKINFWRTRNGVEIDFIESSGVKINAYEIKWAEQNVSFSLFHKHYPQATTVVITFDKMLSRK